MPCPARVRAAGPAPAAERRSLGNASLATLLRVSIRFRPSSSASRVRTHSSPYQGPHLNLNLSARRFGPHFESCVAQRFTLKGLKSPPDRSRIEVFQHAGSGSSRRLRAIPGPRINPPASLISLPWRLNFPASPHMREAQEHQPMDPHENQRAVRTRRVQRERPGASPNMPLQPTVTCPAGASTRSRARASS